MTEINLDYLFSRQTVLNEMGMPSFIGKTYGDAGDKFAALFPKTSKIIREGKKDGKPLTNIKGDVMPGLPGQDKFLKYALICLLPVGEKYLNITSEDPAANVEINLDPDTYDFEDDSPETSTMTDEPTGDSVVNRKRSVALFNNSITGFASKVLEGKGREDKTNYFPELKSGSSEGVYARLRTAIKLLVRDNPEYVLSPKFEHDMLDPVEIGQFIQNNISTNSYSRNRAKEKEEAHGMAYKDILMAQSAMPDVIRDINRAMAAKKRRKHVPTSAPTTPDVKKSSIVNNFTANVDAVLDSINQWRTVQSAMEKIIAPYKDDPETAIDTLKSFNENILGGGLKPRYILALARLKRDKTGNNLLDDLYDEYSEMTEFGISMSDLQQNLHELRDFLPVPQIPVVDLIINDIQQLPSDDDETFPGFDTDVLEKFLDTPEKVKTFKQYYKWLRNKTEFEANRHSERLSAIKNKQEADPGELQILRRDFNIFMKKYGEINKRRVNKDLRISYDDKFLMKKYGLTPDELYDITNTGENIDPSNPILKQINYDKESKGQKPLNADDVKELRRFSKTYEDEGEDDDEDDPFKESYIMEYMTEQVKKDKHPKYRGQFVDLKTNKVKNYGQWLLTRD